MTVPRPSKPLAADSNSAGRTAFPKPTKRPKAPRKAIARYVRPKAKRSTPRRTGRVLAPWYLAIVRKLQCCAPHTIETAHDLNYPSDPHHTRSRGAGGSDFDAIPMWRCCHLDVEALSGVFKGATRTTLRWFYALKVAETRATVARIVNVQNVEDYKPTQPLKATP